MEPRFKVMQAKQGDGVAAQRISEGQGESEKAISARELSMSVSGTVEAR